jgi:hypothetical protein
MGFLCRLHYQFEVMQDESDLALTHAASILLARTLWCRALPCEIECDEQQVWAPDCKVAVVPWRFDSWGKRWRTAFAAI